MKFVYWGAVNSGADHINRMFEFNQKPHTFFTNAAYKFDKYIYPKPMQQEVYQYYKLKHENKLVKVLHKKRCYRVRDPFTEHTYDYMEKYNFIDHRTTNYYSNEEIVDSSDRRGLVNQDVSMYEPYLNYAPDEWDFAVDDMFDGELLVRPHHLLGFSNYQRVYKTTDRIISLLKQTTNIIPYKENIIDSITMKLNMFNPPKQSKKYTQRTSRPVLFKTIVDAYKRDKEIVWNHLDEFTRQQRDIEQALIDYNIPYDYLNLDHDDYSRFKCDIVLDKKFSHGNFDTTNDETKNNYKLLEKIANEYVTVRGLTDPRLSGRIKDGI